MTRQKNQILMFTDAELALISAVFSGDGEDYLYLIRNVLLQFPLSKEERAKLKGIMTSEVYRVVKKKLLPSLDPDAPLGQLGDLNQSLTADLKIKDVEQMSPLLKAKQLEIDYLRQQFDYLRDVDAKHKATITLDDMAVIDGDAEKNYITNTARNFLLGYVDAFLIQLRTIAGSKKETPEEISKRLTRDSSK